MPCILSFFLISRLKSLKTAASSCLSLSVSSAMVTLLAPRVLLGKENEVQQQQLKDW